MTVIFQLIQLLSDLHIFGGISKNPPRNNIMQAPKKAEVDSSIILLHLSFYTNFRYLAKFSLHTLWFFFSTIVISHVMLTGRFAWLEFLINGSSIYASLTIVIKCKYGVDLNYNYIYSFTSQGGSFKKYGSIVTYCKRNYQVLSIG